MKLTSRGAFWIAAGSLGLIALIVICWPHPPLKVTLLSVQAVSGDPAWLSIQRLQHYRATIRIETPPRRGMMLKNTPRAGFNHGYTCLYWDGKEWADAGAFLSLLTKADRRPEWGFYDYSLSTILPGGTVLTTRVDLLSIESDCKLVLEGWGKTNFANSWPWAPRWLQRYLPADSGEFHLEKRIKLPKRTTSPGQPLHTNHATAPLRPLDRSSPVDAPACNRSPASAPQRIECCDAVRPRHHTG